MEFLAKWLTCIFRSVDEIQPDEAIMTQLKQLPILPLANGDMVKLTEKTVFFPITDERKGNKKQKTNRKSRSVFKMYQDNIKYMVSTFQVCFFIFAHGQSLTEIWT